MKIGFNFKKIINTLKETILNHETRITTLENNSRGGSSSGGGSSNEY